MEGFPKTLYIKREEEQDGTIWLNSEEDPKDFAILGEAVKVGRYVLAGITTIRADVVTED